MAVNKAQIRLKMYDGARQPTLTWIVPLLAFSVGCVPVVHRNVPSFANAVTLATENSKSAFDAMEQQHEDVQAERTVISYEKHGSIQR